MVSLYRKSYPITNERTYVRYFRVLGIFYAIKLSVVYPLYYDVTRIATDVGSAKQFDGVINVCKKTLKVHGPLGFYRGYLMMLTGMAINYVFTPNFDPWKRFKSNVKAEGIGYGCVG
ncbi:Mitochondrial substrate/solute carrier [Corchorus olitorius]|uniref:ADP/ATP translocase n=1 Tax=Corchorus olitorius TaxID=93759 RepID=A0A1R3J0H6_9ROSI|nr:Mitochondrial substrate/solute carrier [Corchorus olitorius]